MLVVVWKRFFFWIVLVARSVGIVIDAQSAWPETRFLARQGAVFFRFLLF